jgi:hypothetical protein
MLRLDPSAGAISNHFFQNLAAQGAKLALVRLTRECLTDRKSVLYRAARPVVFVHDEIITELREDVAHECAERQAEVMIAAMRELVPDVRISAVPALARRWFKSMEDVRSADGRLRPWWPPDGVSAKPGESTEAHRARALREWTWAPDQVTMRQDLGW